MTSRLLVVGSLFIGVFLVSIAASAHHGVAAYDMTSKITLKGTIASFDWSNPHCQIHFDVTDEKGNVVHWDFETQSPSVLVHAGWTRNSLKPGDQATIIATPAKDAAPVGLLSKVVLSNGQELTDREK